MNKKDKEDLNKIINGLYFVSDLRIFPNGRKLTLYQSSSLNQIGKLIEVINMAVRMIRDGKKPKKTVRLIRNCRIDIGELIDKFGRMV